MDRTFSIPPINVEYYTDIGGFIFPDLDEYCHDRNQPLSITISIRLVSFYVLFNGNTAFTSQNIDFYKFLKAKAAEYLSIDSSECFIKADNACVGIFVPKLNSSYYLVDCNSTISESLRHFGYTLINALLFFLPKIDSIILHAGSFKYDEYTGLFLADNGGGKSTAISLLSNCKILNDDLVIIKAKETLSAYSTPFGKTKYRSVNGEIKALFVLKKGNAFLIKKLISDSDALTRNWSWQLNRNKYIPKELRVKSMSILIRLFQEIPIYELTFPRDYIDQDQIEAVLKGEHPECFKNPEPEIFR